MLNFPSNTLLQLVPARLPQALARLRSGLWRTLSRVETIAATESRPNAFPFSEAQKARLRPVTGPHHYGKLWDRRWFRLDLPKTPAGAFLRWDDEAEATLHIDGVPFYGFDVAHRFAPLPAGTRRVWVKSVVCQTGIWHPEATGLSPEGSHFRGAELMARDETIWEVLHDFLVLEDLMRDELARAFPGRLSEFGPVGSKPTIERVPPLLRVLLRHLDTAIDALDSGGARAARAVLGSAFTDLRGSDFAPSAVLTGHAHIDLVWLWPESVGEEKAMHTFATANRLMERYPELRFAYSQPASYEAVAKLAPKLHAKVRERIAEGRWEAHGATYVESDTLLACGEALARSFLVGQKEFRKLTGKSSPILWLPDVFGYAGCLPQMMRETGVEYFFTTKLTWNAITPFPYSSFRWVGSDGSEVLAHICQNNGYNQSVSVAELRQGAAAHRNCDTHREFLAPTGYGDGGGGVTEEMCERARRVSNLVGLPRTTWGTLNEFFERMQPLAGKLPAYRGELYFEYHRGTYTTHGDIKAGMRAAERALQLLEAAACATSAGPVDPALWKRVIFAQFHDYIPGSSIHEVYDEAGKELAAINSKAHGQALALLEKPERSAPSVFNPLPRPVRWMHKDSLFELPPLMGVAMQSLQPCVACPVEATTRRLTSERIDARFDSAGLITSLVVDGAEVPLSSPANTFVLSPDFPHAFEAWDIDRQAMGLAKEETRKATATVSGNRTLRGQLSFTRPLGGKSRITVHYILEACSPVLRVAYEVDWHEENTLLKAAFPTSFRGRHARFGAPYGSVRRPQLGGDQQAEAMWEVPASRWAMVADDNESEGLFLVTEAKYGFSCRDGVLALSLLRSAKITNEDRGVRRGSHPESLRRTLAPNICSDLGAHRIEMAIGRFHAAVPREEMPAALADSLFTQPIEYSGRPVSAGLLGLEGGQSIVPAWAAPGSDKDSWTLRLHETLGRSGSVRLLLDPQHTARKTDLSGNSLGEPAENFAFRGYEILSVEISRRL